MSATDLPKILVVDDERAILSIYTEILKQDYQVICAESGQEALEKLRQHEITIILADHMMPEMTGVELLTQSLTIAPQAGRILVTASQKVEHLRDAINLARIQRYLGKPLRIAELREIVRSTLREIELERENSRLVNEITEKNTLLETAIEKIRNHEAELQQLVDERTEALYKAISELEQLALRDGLTGLFNHRYLQESLSAEISRAHRHGHHLGLIFIDVDYFKNFNDKLGHQEGDKLLKDLALVLTNTGALELAQFPGRTSDLVARYGGEEFVVLLPETTKEDTLVRAERIRLSVEQYPFEGRHVQPSQVISVSIGIANYPEDSTTKVGLLKAADTALYQAKNAGRNQVHMATKTNARK